MEQIDTIRAYADFAPQAGELVQRVAGCGALPGLLTPQECYCADEY
jgi:hypothetical protein